MGELERRKATHVDDEENQEVAEFQETHRRLSDRVERLLMQLVILGLVGLVLVQTLAVNPTIRQLVNKMEGLEGIAWNRQPSWSGDAATQAAPALAGQSDVPSITVVLMNAQSAPQAALLVDGKAVGSFTTPTVTARIKAGQSVAIDGSRAKNQTLKFRVVGGSRIDTPALGTEVTVQGDRRPLGVIKLAN